MRRLSVAVFILAFAGCAPAVRTSAEGLTTLREAADRGEAVFGVPADLVLAIAWSETRWTQPDASADPDHGVPALGIAGLRTDLPFDPIALVADRLLVTPSVAAARIATEPAFAILATSAVLRELGDLRGVAPHAGVEAWRDVIADYAVLDGRAGERHAEYVLSVLRDGMAGPASTGERVVLRSRTIAAPPGDGVTVAALGDADYGPALWTAASTENYTAGRGGHSIRYVVIHTMQGSYAGSISWFRNPSASVAAHYLVRSSDGEITQMVHDRDTGWHAGNWTYNQESIGIEHEGYVADPGRWYTDAMYRSSAALTRHLCDTYGIPIDRAHIFGHVEVPGATHTDPGTGWDWDRYMALVRGEPPRPSYDATAGATSIPAEMTSGDRAVAWVELTNTGGTTWDIDGTRLGTSAPQDHASPFFDLENWINDHRASGADHSGYGTGATGRFTFMIHAPEVDSDTTITDTFRLVQEGVTWFGPEVTISVLVHPRVVATPDAGVVIEADAGAPSDGGSVARDAGVSRGDAGTTGGTTMRRGSAEGCACAAGRRGGPGVLAALSVVALALLRLRRS